MRGRAPACMRIVARLIGRIVGASVLCPDWACAARSLTCFWTQSFDVLFYVWCLPRAQFWGLVFTCLCLFVVLCVVLNMLVQYDSFECNRNVSMHNGSACGRVPYTYMYICLITCSKGVFGPPRKPQGAVRTREHAKTALAVHIVLGRSGASAGYQALAHAPACAHRMDFRVTQGVNLKTLAVRRFARCHG